MASTRPLEYCFRFTAGPGTDPVVHSAMLEVEIWRDLHATRHSGPNDDIDRLGHWVERHREVLIREADPAEREYRLEVLRIAAGQVSQLLQRHRSTKTASDPSPLPAHRT